MKYDASTRKAMEALYESWITLVQASYGERDKARRKALIVLALQHQRAYRKVVGDAMDGFYGKVPAPARLTSRQHAGRMP